MGRRFGKGVILAAGMGKRLGHETESLPKALVPMGESSLLELILDNMESFTSVRSVVVATGHFHEQIEQRLGRKRGELDIEYVINDEYETTNNCFTLWLLREHLVNGFLLINTDVLFDGRILERAMGAPHESFIIADVMQPLDEEDMKVRLEDSRVVDISKSLKLEDSDGEYIGILGFGPETSRALTEELDRSVRVEGATDIYYEDVIQRMLEEWPIYSVRSDPYDWIEIDTIQDLSAAREDVYPRIAGAPGWK